MTVLAGHVGHRTEPLDDRRLRCHDCQHTLMLPTRAGSTSPTSNPKDPTPDQACPLHVGEWAHNCRACIADRKANEHRSDVAHQPTADVTARAAEARAALPARAPELPPRRPVDDPERLAQARAEVAARQVVPLPESTEPVS